MRRGVGRRDSVRQLSSGGCYSLEEVDSSTDQRVADSQGSGSTKSGIGA